MLKTIVSNWLVPAIVLSIALLAAYFFGAGWAGLIVVLLFCVTLAVAIVSVVQQQMKLHREKQITRAQLVLNVLFEIFLILLAMSLAAWLGRSIAETATQQLGNDLIKFVVGMVIGLLAGMGVGFLVKQTRDRLAKLY